jgi:peptidoglycan/xylan/chitin deacetylase (PgdA/CDA1 family)
MSTRVRERPARPLILGYHAVSSTWRTQLAVSEGVLRAQLSYLEARGYVGLTFSEAERRRICGTLPERSVVVTFDDGYASTMRALSVLADFGIPGTVFVVTAFVESGELLSWPGIDHWLRGETVDELRPLSWEQLEELRTAGWEVGSHTATHPLLTRADDRLLQTELEVSRAAIESRLGSCSSVSYPYGRADTRVAAAARLARYEAGCTLTFAHPIDEPLLRPRIGMGPTDTHLRLRAQVSRLGRAARRSAVARLAAMLPRRRAWLPGE